MKSKCWVAKFLYGSLFIFFLEGFMVGQFAGVISRSVLAQEFRCR